MPGRGRYIFVHLVSWWIRQATALAASEMPVGLLHGEYFQLTGTLGSHNLGGHCTEEKMAHFVQLLMSWISD